MPTQAASDYNALTAYGTLALAALTLVTLITTIVITVLDRKRSASQLAASQEREREAQAMAVQVYLQETRPVRATLNDAKVSVLIATVVNTGARTITGVQAMFSLDGSSLIGPARTELVAAPSTAMEVGLGVASHRDALAPGGSVKFATDRLPTSQVTDPFVAVRWTDGWGQVWDCRKAEVRSVKAGDVWPQKSGSASPR